MLPDGREAALYTLRGTGGLTLVATNYGCRIVQLWAPDKQGKLGDVVLGHRTLPEYYGANYQGATVGRYANRIGGASFTLGGKDTPWPRTTAGTPCTAAPGASTRCCGIPR